MNYYVYYIEGDMTIAYVGANYVGTWADSEQEAYNKVISHTNHKTTFIRKASYAEYKGQKVGYLY